MEAFFTRGVVRKFFLGERYGRFGGQWFNSRAQYVSDTCCSRNWTRLG